MKIKKSLEEVIRILVINGVSVEEIRETLIELGFPENKVSAKLEELQISDLDYLKDDNIKSLLKKVSIKIQQLESKLEILSQSEEKIQTLEKKIQLIFQLIEEYAPEIFEKIIMQSKQC